MKHPNEIYNPFDEGIAKAIANSRSNLAMTKEQEQAALRNSMLSMAESLRKNPMEKGRSIIDNFRTAVDALGPAVQTYGETENAAINQNNALAQQILAHKEHDEQVATQEEERLWHREHAQNQLEESRRQHDMSNEIQREANQRQRELVEYKTNKNRVNSELDRIAPIIRTDSAFDKTGKQVDAAASFYKEVEEIEDKYKQLKSAMRGAGIDTTDPLAFNKTLRNTMALKSSATKNPKERLIATLYADIQASNKRAMQTAEKALKDGALTNFTVKYGDQNDLFPNIGKDNYDVFETKLKTMAHDARSSYEASELAMRLGRHINKKNYPIVKQWLENEEQRSSAPDMQTEETFAQPPLAPGQPIDPVNQTVGKVYMYDPNTGEKDYVPVEYLEDALNDKLLIVK